MLPIPSYAPAWASSPGRARTSMSRYEADPSSGREKSDGNAPSTPATLATLSGSLPTNEPEFIPDGPSCMSRSRHLPTRSPWAQCTSSHRSEVGQWLTSVVKVQQLKCYLTGGKQRLNQYYANITTNNVDSLSPSLPPSLPPSLHPSLPPSLPASLPPCCQIDVTDAVEAQRSLQAARDQLAQEKVRGS